MVKLQEMLDAKREEIRKLEESARKKEEALRKIALQLEPDEIRFHAFLKENEAMNNPDLQGKQSKQGKQGKRRRTKHKKSSRR